MLIFCFRLMVFVSLFFSTASYAYHQAHQWAVGLGGGYLYLSPRHHVDNTGVVDARLGYQLTDRWGIEGLVGFFNTNSTRASNNKEHVSGNLYAFDVLARAKPWHQWQAYVAAGPSVISLNPNGSDANNEGGVNAALGAEWFASERMALSLECRDFYVMDGGKNEVFPNASVVFLF